MPAGEGGNLSCKTPARTPPPPMPAHLKRALTPLATKTGASDPHHASPCAQTMDCQDLQSGSRTATSPRHLASADAFQAAILLQAAKLKPARANTGAAVPEHDLPCAPILNCHDMQSSAPSAIPPPPQGGLQAAMQQQPAKLKPARAKIGASAPASPPPPPKGGLQASKLKPARATPEQKAVSKQACAHEKHHSPNCSLKLDIGPQPSMVPRCPKLTMMASERPVLWQTRHC